MFREKLSKCVRRYSTSFWSLRRFFFSKFLEKIFPRHWIKTLHSKLLVNICPIFRGKIAKILGLMWKLSKFPCESFQGFENWLSTLSFWEEVFQLSAEFAQLLKRSSPMLWKETFSNSGDKLPKFLKNSFLSVWRVSRSFWGEDIQTFDETF